MGNDYEARRRNKKLNKRVAQDAAEGEDRSKKQRSKGRPKVSFCCWLAHYRAKQAGP